MSQESRSVKPETTSPGRKLLRKVGRIATATTAVALTIASAAAAKPAKSLNAAVHKEAVQEVEAVMRIAESHAQHQHFQMLGTSAPGTEEISVRILQPAPDNSAANHNYLLVGKLPGPPGEGITRGPKLSDITKDNPHNVRTVILSSAYTSLGLFEQPNGSWFISDGFNDGNGHNVSREASTDPNFHGDHVNMNILNGVHHAADVLLAQARVNAPAQTQTPLSF